VGRGPIRLTAVLLCLGLTFAAAPTALAATALDRASVTSQQASTITKAGIVFRVVTTAFTSGYVESAISVAAQQTLLSTVDADVKRIQADHGRKFTTRPTLWAFATVKSFVTGLRVIFGVRNASTFEDAAGVYLSGKKAVAISHEWMAEGTDPTAAATVRHELTHAMVDQIVGKRGIGQVPAWLNEGSARLEEFTIDGLEWFDTSETYVAASMANSGKLWTLEQMRLQSKWNARSGYLAFLQYAAAARAVAFLREDLGENARVIEIMALLAKGTKFAAAYQKIAGTPFTDFEKAFKARVLATSDRYPGIATAQDTPEGEGLYFVLYGFAPRSQVTYTIETGATVRSTYTSTTSEVGAYETYLTTGWPAGTYKITATGSVGTAETVVTKASGAAAVSAASARELAPTPFDRGRIPRR